MTKKQKNYDLSIELGKFEAFNFPFKNKKEAKLQFIKNLISFLKQSPEHFIIKSKIIVTESSKRTKKL